MADNTENLDLVLPELEDFVDLDQLNANFAKIDAGIAAQSAEVLEAAQQDAAARANAAEDAAIAAAAEDASERVASETSRAEYVEDSLGEAIAEVASNPYLSIATYLTSNAPNFDARGILTFGGVQVIAAQYGASGALSVAQVKWSDGSAGVLTVTSAASGFENAWVVTHDESGKQLRQRAVTRNSEGRITARPAVLIETTGVTPGYDVTSIASLLESFSSINGLLDEFETIDDLVQGAS